MLRWTLLLLCMPVSALAISPEDEARIKRLESALNIANQEQQALNTQVQLLQEVRKAETEHYVASMPQAGVAAPPMSYDDMTRLRREHEGHLRQHSDELMRLYARFRDIEFERQRIREQLMELLSSPK